MSTQLLTSTTFAGLDIAINRKPTFMTKRMENVAGKEVRVALRTVPRWTWDVTFNFLRSTSQAQLQSQEFANLTSLYNSLSGGFDSFQWLDPEDFNETLSLLAASTTGTYQLSRQMGTSTNFSENIFAPSTVTQVFAVNSSGVSSASTLAITQNNWGSSIPGQITLSTFTPGSSVSVYATFTYYWPVRWDQDEMQFERFGLGWWEVKKMSFTSII